jgi:hypothetical protein
MWRASLAVAVVLLAGCASTRLPLPAVDDPNFDEKILKAADEAAERDEPTREHPKIGCITSTLRELASVAGKMLPEIVRVIGTYSSDKWMVLRSGEFNERHWQPWPKEKIRFIGCGREADAFREIEAHTQ